MCFGEVVGRGSLGAQFDLVCYGYGHDMLYLGSISLLSAYHLPTVLHSVYHERPYFFLVDAEICTKLLNSDQACVGLFELLFDLADHSLGCPVSYAKDVLHVSWIHYDPLRYNHVQMRQQGFDALLPCL